ncbi:MAG: MFS transporter [Deltaproteobacteria bacterium]
MAVRLNWNLRWRLSVLWLLEWGITGAVMTYLPIYWESIGLSKHQQSQLYAVMAVGLWVAPFVLGQVADRWLAIEKVLAASHFVGGISLYALATAMDLYQETASNFQSLLWLVGIFAVAYIPTVPLVSALCFRHLPHPDEQFGKVRVWGTVGWMIGGLSLSFWLERTQVFAWVRGHHPEWSIVYTFREILLLLPRPSQSDCFRMSAFLSFALSSFCVFLPHTPPAKKPHGQVAPLAVLGMFRDKTFSLFIAISSLLAVLVVPLYNMAVPPLLKELHVPGNWVPTVMLIGQVSEFPALLLLSFCLRRLGLKVVFATGIAAWALRYSFFSLGGPWPLVLTGLALHGVCHVFLIVVAQLYLDAKCPKDLRASAQNLLSFITLGVGFPLGTLLGGVLRERFKESAPMLFAAPAVAAIVLLLIFWKTVNFPAAGAAATAGGAVEPGREGLPA